jgi:hypothetical protein
MAVYTISGQGTQTVTKPTQHLLVQVTAHPDNTSFGEAFPANYYHLGFFRLARGAFYYPPIPIHALQMSLDLESYVTDFAWGLKPGVTCTVTEANN